MLSNFKVPTKSFQILRYEAFCSKLENILKFRQFGIIGELFICSMTSVSFSSDQNLRCSCLTQAEPGGEIAIDQRYDVRKFIGPYSNII